MVPQKRTYRKLGAPRHLAPFRVVVKETDLMVYTARPLEKLTRDLVLRHRGYLEAFIGRYPRFAETLEPWYTDEPAPGVVADMIDAGKAAGVGPMAAVAGALAGRVGSDLLQETDEVMVENGGDIFIKTRDPIAVGIYAGRSPLSMKIGLRVNSGTAPVSVCTSSGTIGHSKSFGRADAVCVLAPVCALADASATAIANRVGRAADIQEAIDFGKRLSGVAGGVVIKGKTVGFWGEIEPLPMEAKKG